MSGRRLATGGLVDRSRSIAFRFDGRTYRGHPGDTLASALLANGVSLVGRSFKYHRPRGILAAGAEEPNAIVQLGEGAGVEPNARATQVELHDGLVAESVNRWPSLALDLGAVNQLAGKVLVAGFYYKTFLWPRGFWDKVYEPIIRRAAGLGRAPDGPDPDAYDKMHVHAEVLVVGGGRAGLTAALEAARAGGRVVLMDEQAALGGHRLGIDPQVGDLAAELAAQPDVTILTRTTATGLYDGNYVLGLEKRTDHLAPGTAARAGARQRLWHVRAGRVILATGAHERPLVFGDNDRPGVMLASAVRTYLHRYGVAPGGRAVVATNNDSAYATAFDLAQHGVTVAAIVDCRRHAPDAMLSQARAHGITVLQGSVVSGVKGRGRVQGAKVHELTLEGGDVLGGPQVIDCDLIAVSGGFSPVVHLWCHRKGRLDWDDDLLCFKPLGTVEGVTVVGRAAGDLPGLGPIAPLWLVPNGQEVGQGPKRFVDVQNDVTALDIQLSAQENLASVEHMKRWTGAGLGTDQGKTGNINALALLAQWTGRDVEEAGTTTFRAPYTPVAFGALAGREVGSLIEPIRTTPIHPWHVARGAVMEDVGQWKRPRYFPSSGESMDDAVNRECRAVRQGVGALDASTLGKIEVTGPDAAEFLDRLYINPVQKLAVGGCRYGVMCRDDGMVFDDGVIARLGPERFHLTTTTGGAARVLDWMEEWLQTEWPHLKVYLTSTTEQWSTVALAGPRARAVMQRLAPDLDTSSAVFPHLAHRTATVAGLDAWVWRMSFSGELGFEINVSAEHGLALWQAVMEAGRPEGIVPYGLEAMHILRAEKGFFIIGHETDGTVTPIDLGLGRMAAKKRDFLGKRALQRPDAQRADRKHLVGLLTEEAGVILPEGGQLVAAMKQPPVPMLGHVTSSYWSATLGRSIALALVKGGRDRMGERLICPVDGQDVAVRVVSPVFYDAEGARLDG
ncbi:2Fe-2S iron-sulfur cluster-binding protein [Zavarzinia sp. CC-PAN008]|uniref:2Fe-2S iron-sulfur cluster-binding protein n=1 Tax=Zavarzinia sp. CC-PAN008 TaxID=3243332 RepID=UPI003F743F6D